MSSFDAFPGKPTGIEIRWRSQRQPDGRMLVEEIYPDETFLRWVDIPYGQAASLIEERRALVRSQCEQIVADLRQRLMTPYPVSEGTYARPRDKWGEEIREKGQQAIDERRRLDGRYRRKPPVRY